MMRLWLWLGEQRCWSWPILALYCDVQTRREQGHGCIRWRDHRDIPM